MPKRRARVLIAGVGNELMGDDGLGPVVLGELGKRSLPEEVEIINFGERLYDLLLKLRDYDAAIVVDALDLGGEPGEVYVVEPNPSSNEVRGLGTLDLHEATLKGLIALGRELDIVPEKLHIIGCQPLDTLLGRGLSAVVRGRVNDILDLVEKVLKGYIAI